MNLPLPVSISSFVAGVSPDAGIGWRLDRIAGDCPSTSAYSELHDAALRGDIRALREQIAQGVDVNARGFMGWTALHLVVMGFSRSERSYRSTNCYEEATEILLQAGANPALHDRMGSMPAHSGQGYIPKPLRQKMLELAAAGTWKPEGAIDRPAVPRVSAGLSLAQTRVRTVEAVRLIRAGELTRAQAAKKYNVTENCVRRWLAKNRAAA